MKRTSLIGQFVLAVVILLLVSCGASGTLVLYEGERRPAPEIARIDVHHRGTLVTQVDGLTSKRIAISEKYVEVLPGQHTVEVRYSSRKGKSRAALIREFTAEAGHIYIVKTRAGLNRWNAWIEDMADGSIMAGSRDLTHESAGQITPSSRYPPSGF